MKHPMVKQVDYFAQKEHIEEEARKHTSYIASKMPDETGNINTNVILEKQDHTMFCTLFRNAWRELLRIISGYRKGCDFIPDKNVVLEALIKDNKQLTVTPTSLSFDASGNLLGTRTLTVTPTSLSFDASGNLLGTRTLTVTPTSILIQ